MGRLSNTATTAIRPFRSRFAVASLAAVAVLSFTGIQVAGQQVAGAAGYASQTVIASGFNVPWGVAVDGSGNIYVADTGNGQIVKMDSSGNNRTVISTESSVGGVAIDGSGNVYVTNYSNGQIVKMDSSGNNRTVIATLGNAVGVAVDVSGNVFVATGNGDQIVKLDSSGNNSTTIATGLGATLGVAVDGSGNVYVAATNYGEVRKMDSSGNNSTTIATGFSFPYGLAVDGSGGVYVADTGNGQIVKMDSSGNNRTVIATGLNLPSGVAVDGSGNVYVTDRGNGTGYGQIVKLAELVTPTPPSISNIPSATPVGGFFAPQFATDGDGIGSVTSSTPTTCTVSTTGIVSFRAHGTCTLTPSVAASATYKAATGTPQSFVVQITPSLHWTKPKPFTYGTPLSPLQLDAGASVLGIFVYSPPNGTVLSAGSHTMTATFYPWDSTNYASVSISTTMIVKVARSTTTLTMSASSIAFSAEAAETFTVSSYTSTGVPNSGPVNVMAGKVLQCVAVLDSTGTGTCSLNDTELRPGRYAIKATTMGNSNVKGSLSVSQLLTVTG